MNNLDIKQTGYLTLLIKLGSHNVLAIIALISIGSATRVMEAGLACPDWPLCYGNLLPLNHMNLKVFLEWFHRLDAFLVGIFVLTQFTLSLIWRKYLPNWLPKSYSFLVFLILLQGSLGALTVINTLASATVTAHLLIAFVILITSIFVNQNLNSSKEKTLLDNNKLDPQLIWWKTFIGIPLLLTFLQSIIGASVSSTWSAHICLEFNQQCFSLNIHRLFAIPTSISILIPIFFSIHNKKLFIFNQKLLISMGSFLILQISLGFLSLKTNLTEPFILVSHQLIASLLIATLSALFFKNQSELIPFQEQNSKLIFN